MTTVATTPSADATVVPCYRVQLIDLEGNVVRTERLQAATDDEALAIASTMTDGYAAELWDRLRFVEHFDPHIRTLKRPDSGNQHDSER